MSGGLSIERKFQRQKNRDFFGVGIFPLGAYKEGASMEKGGGGGGSFESVGEGGVLGSV